MYICVPTECSQLLSADCTLKKSSSKCEVLHDRNGNSEGALEAFSVKGWCCDIPLPWKFFSKLQLHGVKGFGRSDGFRSSFLVLGWLLRSPCCLLFSVVLTACTLSNLSRNWSRQKNNSAVGHLLLFQPDHFTYLCPPDGPRCSVSYTLWGSTLPWNRSLGIPLVDNSAGNLVLLKICNLWRLFS